MAIGAGRKLPGKGSSRSDNFIRGGSSRCFGDVKPFNTSIFGAPGRRFIMVNPRQLAPGEGVDKRHGASETRCREDIHHIASTMLTYRTMTVPQAQAAWG